jgi:DNA-binding Lrp family transcriptional regulator
MTFAPSSRIIEIVSFFRVHCAPYSVLLILDELYSVLIMAISLDETDFEIVRQLQNNARLSNKELAARLGLAPSTTLVRTRRLERAAVLRGYHADVDPALLGRGLQALIAVRLRQHTAADVASFRGYVLGLPEVLRLYHMAGANDFLVHVGVRDSDALRDFAMGKLTTRSEVVHLETGLIFSCLAPQDEV